MADQLHSLPDDVTLFNILPRLPAESLLRFKCVSKQWYTSINTRKFVNMHLKHVTNFDDNLSHHKLLVKSFTPGPFTDFKTIDCEALEDGLSGAHPLPFTNLSMAYHVQIFATCNGLICVGTQEYKSIDNDDRVIDFSTRFYNDLILWNPLTGEYKTLSKANAHKYCFADDTCRGLYHTSFDDDYKLLCVTHDNQVYVYSLKLDSWRKVEETNILSIETGCLYEPYSCLDGSVYFSGLPDEIAADRKIIRFDTKTEKFAEIVIPSFENQRKRFHFSLLEVRGSIHLCALCDIKEADSSKWMIEFWRLNEDFENWTKVLSYFWIPSSEIVGPKLPLCAPAALHLTRNGSLLMSMRHNVDIYKIDFENHTHNERNLYKFEATDVYIYFRGKYIETFVSPNQYTK